MLQKMTGLVLVSILNLTSLPGCSMNLLRKATSAEGQPMPKYERCRACAGEHIEQSQYESLKTRTFSKGVYFTINQCHVSTNSSDGGTIVANHIALA